MMPQDEAMDFYSQLDINEIFMLVITYQKPKVAVVNGLASTFDTAADYVDKKEQQKRRLHGNQKDKTPEKTLEQGKNSDANTGTEKRKKVGT
jgi:hypothetical protein